MGNWTPNARSSNSATEHLLFRSSGRTVSDQIGKNNSVCSYHRPEPCFRSDLKKNKKNIRSSATQTNWPRAETAPSWSASLFSHRHHGAW
jgi:hypothetical protein